MKKFTAFIAACLLLHLYSYAQTYDTTKYFGKMGYVFHNVNKTPITTGILRDYGIEFLNLDNYTGTVLHDSNFVSLHEWRLLYSSIFTSQISSNSMKGLDSMNRLMNKNSLPSQPISFIGLYYKYNKLKDNAVTSNLMYVSNDRLYDVAGRTQSPYEDKELFAVAPIRQAILKDSSTKYIFRPEMFVGNTGKTIQSVAYNATGGTTYTTVALNTAFTVVYTGTGFYNFNIRVTYTDGTIRYGHTKVAVQGGSGSSSRISARYGNWELTPPTTETVTATKAYSGTLGQGTITIDLAQNNNTGQIRKPLIVVEGFDPDGTFVYDDPDNFFADDYVQRLTFDLNTGASINLNDQLDNTNDYDLIFVNWGNGTDYIQRNAFLLERVIQIVNQRKTTYNGVRQQNVIIGASMGGLIVRYALRDMELTSLQHETRLFISHDAPHHGANVPISAQLAVQHLSPWQLVDFNWSRGIFYRDLFPEAISSLALFNAPASRQMLIQRYVLGASSITADNSMYTAFMTEINNMGWPLNSRNLVLSNGRCDGGLQFPDNSLILTVTGQRNFGYWGSLLANLIITAYGNPTIPNYVSHNSIDFNRASVFWQFPLSLFSTRSTIELDFALRAVPATGTSEIYRGDIIARKRILNLINVRNFLVTRHVNSNSSMLPLDNAPGGFYDVDEFGIDPAEITAGLTEFMPGATSIIQQPRFCFIPTVSSVALNNPFNSLRSNICNTIGCNTPTQVYNFYTPPQNQAHVSYTQANSNWILLFQNAAFNCPKLCPSTLFINGPSAVCNTASYNISNVPAGATVNWQSSNPSLASVPATGNPVTVTRTGNGQVTLTATIVSTCQSTVIPKVIAAGPPLTPSISYVKEPPANGTWYTFTSTFTGISTGFDWYVNNVRTRVNADNITYLEIPCGQTYNIKCNQSNACGTSPFSATTMVTNFGCSGLMAFTVAPNPATDLITIQANDNNMASKTTGGVSTDIAEIKIYDQLGVLRKQKKYSPGSRQVQISAGDLPTGIYFIEIINDKKKERQQLVITK